IIGHIAFCPVIIGKVDRQWFGVGPVSVAVEKQRSGIGSKLIIAGLDWLRSHGASGCVLIGNPAYYSRFGFISDGKITYRGLPTEYVQWVSFDGTPPTGALKYSPAFGA
ncbi:MAG: N-acetyltransferase, partial [Devosiaceae bacterium]|nr:N-acetyltransferase [Devosiaceae bacterium]